MYVSAVLCMPNLSFTKGKTCPAVFYQREEKNNRVLERTGHGVAYMEVHTSQNELVNWHSHIFLLRCLRRSFLYFLGTDRLLGRGVTK